MGKSAYLLGTRCVFPFVLVIRKFRADSLPDCNHQDPSISYLFYLPLLCVYFFIFVMKFLKFNFFLYSRFLLVIHFIHISVYMSIPISQFITPPSPFPPLSPLGVHTFFLYFCVSVSALQTGSSVPFCYDILSLWWLWNSAFVLVISRSFRDFDQFSVSTSKDLFVSWSTGYRNSHK